MKNPIYDVTKTQMLNWLNTVLAVRAAVPESEQMADNSDTIISAIKELLTEFEDDDTVITMLGKLPWVD